MDTDRWQRVQEVFHAVADRAADERAALLRELCGDDTAMIDEVTRLLEAEVRTGSLLDAGLPTVAQRLMHPEEDGFLGLRFGPYKLLRLLGEGGMGAVYLAEREDLGSLAAIKILRDALLSPARREMFAREQRTLAQLNYPSIARLYDADTLADGTPYLVMEYVEGVYLTRYCEEHGCSLKTMLLLFRTVCEAVQYAHSHAIVHRDLKPSNILVTGDGAAKLLDFGIARQLDSLQEAAPQSHKTAVRLMTPAYAAPEHMRGGYAGTQTDVYSLGVILYELLCGRLPYDFTNMTAGEAERALQEQEPLRPSVVVRQRVAAGGAKEASASDWSELDVLCMTAMHKDTRRRYASVEALIRDVDHFLKKEPLEARPDTFLYRANRMMVRNRRGLTVAAAVFAIFLVVVTFFSIRLAGERARALAEAARATQIQRFMLSLFDGGDRAEGPSGSLRVTDILDRGVQEAQALGAEPRTQADLYRTLADIYEKLGKFDRSEQLLQTALKQEQAHHGADDLEAADTMAALGMVRIDQARLADADTLIHRALAIETTRLGPNDPDRIRAVNALGRLQEERGDYKGAIATLSDAVQLQTGVGGSSAGQATAALADSLSELADAHYYLDQYDEADALNRRALAINRQIYGTAHPRVADSLVDLGEIQHGLGHDAEAEQYYRQALAIKKSWYGEVHPDTATCMAAVGQSLIYQKKYDEAAPFVERAVEIQEQIYGKMHPQVAIALNQLALLELRRGEFSLAERDFERMAQINRAAYGDHHLLVGVALLNLAQSYLEDKKYRQAEEYFREALSRFVEQLPANHPNIAIAQAKLGKTLAAEHKYRDAEPYLLSAYQSFSKQTPPPEERVKGVREDLATTYEALGEAAKAEEFRR